MNSKSGDQYLVGLSWWRTKCLLFTLGHLLVVVVINLGLTLWMLKVLKFSSNGMGAMKVIPGGLQLRAPSLVQDKLKATKIGSRKGQPVLVESSQSTIKLMTTSGDGRVNSKISLVDDRLDMTTSSVKVSVSTGKQKFTADKRKVIFGADFVSISGDGGTVIQESVQTPLIRPEAGQNLTLESPTRVLNVFALHEVNVESRAGDINVNAQAELKLQSKGGSIKLDAPNVYLPKLQSSMKSLPKDFTSSRSGPSQKVYQVCLCGKGWLFLAPAEEPCVADNDVCR